MLCRYPDIDVLERGIKLLIDKQLPSGDWPQVHLPSGLSRGFPDVLGIVRPLQMVCFPLLGREALCGFQWGTSGRQ